MEGVRKQLLLAFWQGTGSAGNVLWPVSCMSTNPSKSPKLEGLTIPLAPTVYDTALDDFGILLFLGSEEILADLWHLEHVYLPLLPPFSRLPSYRDI